MQSCLEVTALPAERRPRTASRGAVRPCRPGDTIFPGRVSIDQSRLAPTCVVVVDAEEDFDWGDAGRATGHSTASALQVADLHAVTRSYGLRPAHLLTYPMLCDAAVMRTIRSQLDRGLCEVGIQLHGWVTPPFANAAAAEPSYAGQLPDDIVAAKLETLVARFEAVFAMRPAMFRAGRYGTSATLSRLLEREGIRIDTSLAPRTDMRGQGGPDFSRVDSTPFWFGTRRAMLQVPLCRDLAGWSGGLAPALHRAAADRRGLGALLSRTRCAERITLSPEGNDPGAARRLIAARRARGERLFPLSFHSTSLAPGRNPYVRSRADLHAFHDRLSAMLDGMARDGFAFAALSELPGLLGAMR